MAADAEAQLDAKKAELKELVREANGTLKDIRAERAATEKTIREFRDNIDARLTETAESVLRAGLEELGKSIDHAITMATQSVYNRFDMIAGICLGEDAISRADGKPAIEALVRKYVAEKGLRF